MRKKKKFIDRPELGLLVDAHRQALQTQLAHRAAINRGKIRVADVRFRKTRQQPGDRDGDRGAPQDVADAMMWPSAERKDSLWLAVDVEAQRIREGIGIIVWCERRRPYHHA